MKKQAKMITIVASIMIVSGILLAVAGYFSGAKLSLIRDGNGFKVLDSGNQVSESFPLDSFTKNGDITLKDIKTTALQVSNQYGDMSGQAIDTERPNLTLADGDLTLNTVNANNAVINNQYGDILFHHLDSQALDVQNESGNVTLEGTLLGTSRVSVNYGDIHLILKNKQSELNYNIQSEFGDISINNNHFEGSVIQTADSNHQFNITAQDGDVQLQF